MRRTQNAAWFGTKLTTKNGKRNVTSKEITI